MGGHFNGASSIGGQTRGRIARLIPATGLADAFNPDANDLVYAIAVQADGKILTGSTFTILSASGGVVTAVPRNNIARLESDGRLDRSLDLGIVGGNVSATAIQPDGKIVIGGSFSTVLGVARTNIARLNTDGTLDTVFNPNANDGVYSIAVQPDGKIVAGGFFTSIGGQTRNRIARLAATTGLADSFNPNANNFVESIAVQADGKILVGGYFTGANSIGGHPRSRFARLSNDTIAVQNLAVAQTAVTWTRGGSSPQFARVTFEDSTDGVSYNFLGHGTPSGSNWTLTGLNLSVGQNLHIRARGYYRSGFVNGSESLMESVRNVFLTLPPSSPRLNIQRGANANVVLSWGTEFTGYTLESNTNLNTSVWSVVSPAPVVSGANYVVTNTASGPKRAYRLRK